MRRSGSKRACAGTPFAGRPGQGDGAALRTRARADPVAPVAGHSLPVTRQGPFAAPAGGLLVARAFLKLLTKSRIPERELGGFPSSAGPPRCAPRSLHQRKQHGGRRQAGVTWIE